MVKGIKWISALFYVCVIAIYPGIVDALIINEIYFNPPSPIGDDDGEFIELFNEEDYSIDLTGYSIGGITISLNGVIVGAKGFLVLSSELLDDADNDGYNFTSLYGNGDGVLNEFPFPLVDFTGSLANTGELLTIYGPGGEIIESYNYVSFLDSAADGGGFSVERINPQMPAIDSNFGVSAQIWGTPGGWNSIAVWNPSQTPSAVPEPATILLILSGVTGIVVPRVKRYPKRLKQTIMFLLRLLCLSG